MVARPAPERAPTPDAVEFVKFCYARRGIGWPELYDEMCAVAGRGLFRGWSAEDLAEHGIVFTLLEMPRLASLVTQIVAEERARSEVTPVRLRVRSAAGA